MIICSFESKVFRKVTYCTKRICMTFKEITSNFRLLTSEILYTAKDWNDSLKYLKCNQVMFCHVYGDIRIIYYTMAVLCCLMHC